MTKKTDNPQREKFFEACFDAIKEAEKLAPDSRFSIAPTVSITITRPNAPSYLLTLTRYQTRWLIYRILDAADEYTFGEHKDLATAAALKRAAQRLENHLNAPPPED